MFAATSCPTRLRDSPRLGLGASLNAGTAHSVAQAQQRLGASDIARAGRRPIPPSHRLSAMLLEWIGERPQTNDRFKTRAADAIEGALEGHRIQPAAPAILGGPLGTKAFGKNALWRACAQRDFGLARLSRTRRSMQHTDRWPLLKVVFGRSRRRLGAPLRNGSIRELDLVAD